MATARISSKGEVNLSKVFKCDKGEYVYQATAVSTLSQGIAYFGLVKCREEEVTDEDIENCLQLIPDENIFPAMDTSWKIFDGDLSSDEVYLKEPFLQYDHDRPDDIMARCLENEVRVFEKLQNCGHDNIGKLHSSQSRLNFHNPREHLQHTLTATT